MTMVILDNATLLYIKSCSDSVWFEVVMIAGLCFHFTATTKAWRHTQQPLEAVMFIPTPVDVLIIFFLFFRNYQYWGLKWEAWPLNVPWEDDVALPPPPLQFHPKSNSCSTIVHVQKTEFVMRSRIMTKIEGEPHRSAGEVSKCHGNLVNKINVWYHKGKPLAWG